MKKLITVGAALLATITLAACGSTTSSSSGPSSAASSKSASKLITRTAYSSIKLGDMGNNGDGGDTLKDLTAKYGKPESSTTATTNGIKVDGREWNNVEGGSDAKLIVSFVNEKAVGKNKTAMKTDRKNDITLDAYNKITTGTSYDDVNKQLGEPNSINESVFSGTTTLIAVYMNKDMTQFATITFTNNAVSSKTETNLK